MREREEEAITQDEDFAAGRETARTLVPTYLTRKGVSIEFEIYISHVVKQAGGNPQAIHDMPDESAKGRPVDERKVRAMRHQAKVRYLDFKSVQTDIRVSRRSSAACKVLSAPLEETDFHIS